MTHFAPTLAVLALCAAPLAAQEVEPDDPSMMEQGARLFFQGLMDEMEPALTDLEGMAKEMGPMLKEFSAEMGPALGELMGKVDDWSQYHSPEMLPNGDIIMRRRLPDEPAPTVKTADDEIET